MIEVVALIIFIIILMFAPAAAALTVHSDIEIDSVKTKIKDFFYPKYKEDNMYYNPNKPCEPREPPSSEPLSDDLRALYQEAESKDAEIKYVEELKRIQKDLADKNLRLERLYANEDEFEMLYILIHTESSMWSPVSEYGSKWVKGIYQTRSEANEAIKGNYADYQIVEFNYLPNKEEE